MEELDDGLLIYSNNANFVADSFLLDDLWVFSKEGLGGSVLGGSNSGNCHGQKNTILDSGKCSYIAQPNSDILPFSTLEDAETGLEWLSTFEDSSCASDIAGNSGESPQKQSHPESKHISFNMVIPCRARSKRTRFQLHPSKSLDTSSTTTQKPQSKVQYAEQNQEKEEEKNKLKKVKRKAVKGRESNGAQPRRCTHCQTQKTPQWRQGPLGPKTLCNACGVRFKTGRLYPEYRPAKSPSFVNYLHSNSHKKVLEMRTVGIGCGIRMHDLPAASAAALHILHHHSFSFC